MKPFRLLLITLFCFNALVAVAKESIGILSLDIKGLNIDAAVATNIARNELEKLGKYEILDKYDMEYALKKDNMTITDCFGRQCLLEAGRRLKADKMLTGSIELYGNSITLNLRLLDVTSGTIRENSSNSCLF
jgi:PBP1b-binding outer membrane lipoprotein LpoB